MHTLQNSRLAWYNQNITYFILDIIWAMLVSFVVYEFNSDETTINTLLVWFITLLFFWRASANPLRFFGQSYRHPVRLFFSVGMVALVYFFVLRADYSIVSLTLASILWVFGALWLRLFLLNIKPAQRVLGHPCVLENFYSNLSLSKIACSDPNLINLEDFDCVVFDPKFDYPESWREFFVHVTTVGIPVFSVSELQELAFGKVPVELLQESWIDQSFVLNRFYLKFKRFIDLLVSVLFLPLVLFVSLLVALMIKLFMGGEILFRQQRVGLGGKVFTIYKFRTMNETSDKFTESVECKYGNSDPRITKLGKWLRKFRLDELPQFFNVMIGEMSLIGPRPEWLHTANNFAKEIPLYQLRHIVRPGITGWAQVQQGHTTGTVGNYQKLRYDIYYIKHCSVWLDLKVIIMTLHTLLFGKGV